MENLFMRQRLGLKPHDDLPTNCACGRSLDEDPAHFHSCLLVKSAATARHNRLVNMLAKEARASGAYVQKEYCPFGQTRARPDLTVVFPDESLLVDAVVSHPAAPSRASLEPLAMARQAEREKVDRYTDLARQHGARVLAFSVESYGGFGEHATEIIQKIRKEKAILEGESQSNPDQRLPQRLAICLQKGNAIISRAGALKTRKARWRQQ